jgi:hypothetical protein
VKLDKCLNHSFCKIRRHGVRIKDYLINAVRHIKSAFQAQLNEELSKWKSNKDQKRERERDVAPFASNLTLPINYPHSDTVF